MISKEGSVFVTNFFIFSLEIGSVKAFWQF